ncbi:hypothetical protein [Sphingobacterium siyangense]|uniref:hypothetical protein n=2 Tax=Sphingobacterium siyangense TaxID=459529 RepID=UPI002FD89C10
MDLTGIIRRTDFDFRAEYPEISTTIYEISKNSFVIYCATPIDNFEERNDYFEYSIKPMTAPVRLTLVKPDTFLQKIRPIQDDEIAKGFEGISLSESGLFNLLLSKFPDINFDKIQIDRSTGKITVFTIQRIIHDTMGRTHHFLSTVQREKLTAFIHGLKLAQEFDIVDHELTDIAQEYPNYESNPIQFLHAARINKNATYEFSLRDEALWYDNIDRIFSGSFDKNELYFYDRNTYSCYVDFSTFSNIDLRNHLLLYQIVYVTPPFEKDIEKWLAEAKIKKNEFLDLIACGRIRLVLTQPEQRYDIGFIRDAYTARPEAVITRRALATLQQADIVDVSNNYILNDQKLIEMLLPAAMDIAQKQGLDPKFLYEMVLWPIKARRKSFLVLEQKGIFSTSVFGINNAVEKKVSEAYDKDLSFEFTVNSSAIHLASALDATYFPFKSDNGYSDIFYASCMGDFLNFYKSASFSSLGSYMESRQERDNGVVPINPIDIITVNDFISVTELEREIKKYPTFQGGNHLMQTLAPLDKMQRDQKITYYNEQIVKSLNGNKIMAPTLDLGTNLVLDGLGILTGMPFIGSLFSLIKTAGKGLNNSFKSEQFSERIDKALKDNPDRKNIHYLTKINRVARLKDKS